VLETRKVSRGVYASLCKIGDWGDDDQLLSSESGDRAVEHHYAVLDAD